MNLHQFRFVQEAARRDLNLTETAKALFTSQPGISKAILELEAELGVDIFARHGKRLRRITEPGQEVLKCIEVIMREVGNLKRIGEEFSMQDAGTLSIATTHSQARYFLPEPVAQLRKRFPKVNISLHQGSPEQVARMVRDEVADIGVATEALADDARARHLALLRVAACGRDLTAGQGTRSRKSSASRSKTSRDAAAGVVPPVVQRPHAGRPGLRGAPSEARHRARGDRRRRDQDLRAHRPGRGHRRRDSRCATTRQAAISSRAPWGICSAAT